MTYNSTYQIQRHLIQK